MNKSFFSFPKKQDHLRAVHCKPGPLGKFIATALNMGASVGDISFYKEGTVSIEIRMDDSQVEQFQKETGFGLQDY